MSAKVIHPHQGQSYDWANDNTKIHLSSEDTQGSFTLVEDRMKPTFSLGLHLHKQHAETFHILEGRLEFRLGEETVEATPGTTVYIPAGTPHAVRVVGGAPARMLMLYQPAGFETILQQFSRMSPEDFANPELMKSLEAEHDNYALE